MPASKTQIVNLALQRIGVSKQVANVDTENSKEAMNAKTAYDDERDYVLRDFPWPFATKYVAPGLVAGSSTVAANLDWNYSYRYPSDAVYVRRILSALGRNDPDPPPFKVGRDDQGRLIYTNQAEAQIEYTMRVTNPEEFDPLFVSAFAWRLGWVLAPSLSRVEKIADHCLKMYAIELSKAQAGAGNEQQQEKQIEAEWIRGR